MIPSILSNITITYGSVPVMLESPVSSGVLWQATAGRFLLDVPDTARYLVENGKSIIIDRRIEAPDSDVEMYLRMAPLSALLNQRGILSFHAAAVAKGDYAVLLAGNSGVGKSTLLTALVQQGWEMLADDLAVVSIDDQPNPLVYPTFPEIYLWQEALTRLGIDSRSLPYSANKRRQLTFPDQFATRPKLLCGIYWMTVYESKSNECKLELAKLTGAKARLGAIGEILYNSHITDAVIDRIAYMKSTAGIAHSVPLYRLKLPFIGWDKQEVIEKIEANLPESIG